MLFGPDPERAIVNIVAAAFVGSLAAVDLEQLDEQKAAAAVAEAEQAALAAIREHATTGLLIEAKASRHAQEREELRREAEAERAAQLERDGRKALRQLFGSKLAGQVESW